MSNVTRHNLAELNAGLLDPNKSFVTSQVAKLNTHTKSDTIFITVPKEHWQLLLVGLKGKVDGNTFEVVDPFPGVTLNRHVVIVIGDNTRISSSKGSTFGDF